MSWGYDTYVRQNRMIRSLTKTKGRRVDRADPSEEGHPNRLTH